MQPASLPLRTPLTLDADEPAIDLAIELEQLSFAVTSKLAGALEAHPEA